MVVLFMAGEKDSCQRQIEGVSHLSAPELGRSVVRCQVEYNERVRKVIDNLIVSHNLSDIYKNAPFNPYPPGLDGRYGICNSFQTIFRLSNKIPINSTDNLQRSAGYKSEVMVFFRGNNLIQLFGRCV